MSPHTQEQCLLHLQGPALTSPLDSSLTDALTHRVGVGYVTALKDVVA